MPSSTNVLVRAFWASFLVLCAVFKLDESINPSWWSFISLSKNPVQKQLVRTRNAYQSGLSVEFRVCLMKVVGLTTCEVAGNMESGRICVCKI